MSATQYTPVEWSYTSRRAYDDPFNEVELDVILAHVDGTSWRVPAYWAGGQTWRLRFAPPKRGGYTFRTVCSDPNNEALHNQTGTLKAATPAHTSKGPMDHGPLRIDEDRRGFEHADGTPFFWLGDTWWMGLSKRLGWPGDVQRLAYDRLAKGFTVIQIVAGLYPDMPALDPRGANEAGFPWEEDFERINPAYFDMADVRIQWLVNAGLLPCIVGC
ncbi:MAG: DUF4038 domain-containing protein [Anaerolineae bacterium]